MPYDKNWSVLGSAAIFLVIVLVVALAIYFFSKSDFYKDLNVCNYDGSKPYVLLKGQSVKLYRKQFKFVTDGSLTVEEFEKYLIIKAESKDAILYCRDEDWFSALDLSRKLAES